MIYQHVFSTIPPRREIRPSLQESLKSVSEKCIECKLCRKECLFLQKYGKPKELADTCDPENGNSLNLAFQCSLCGLCGAVCPVGLDPSVMFLEMRRQSVDHGTAEFSDHRKLIGYERRGTSKRYSYYALPKRCKTVLFPGCALPGTRPDKVKELFLYLRREIPGLGVVLDCCTKPSHDLGCDEHFQEMFVEMREYLLHCGVEKVLVACPNCYRVFHQYGTGLQIETVYECLADKNMPVKEAPSGEVTVHDPCGTRYQKKVHEAVRRLAGRNNLRVNEMVHHGSKTICCGEGGSVYPINPELGKAWSFKRKQEAGSDRMLTYCAGCANYLGSFSPTIHILDLLFEPEAAMAGRAKVSKAPFTYWNRLRLKKWFREILPACHSRERTFRGTYKAGPKRKLPRFPWERNK